MYFHQRSHDIGIFPISNIILCCGCRVSSIISSWQLGPGCAAHDSCLSSGLSPPRSLRESTSITVTDCHHDRLEVDSVGSSDITLYRDICLLRTLPLCFLTEEFLQRTCHGSEESPWHDPGLLTSRPSPWPAAAPQSPGQVPGVGPSLLSGCHLLL